MFRFLFLKIIIFIYINKYISEDFSKKNPAILMPKAIEFLLTLPPEKK